MSDPHAADPHAAGPHAAHHTNYVKIWAILIVLLIASIVGPMIGIQIVTLLTAFGIAFVKAYLVATRFMHLDVERPVVWYSLGAALAVMVLFFAAVSPDVLNHEGARWVNVAAKAEMERREAAHKSGGDAHGATEHGAAGSHHAAPAPGAAPGGGEHGAAPAGPAHP